MIYRNTIYSLRVGQPAYQPELLFNQDEKNPPQLIHQ
jgi:hypothetical protein